MRAHKRRWSVIGALALVLSTLAIGVATAPIASADTTQNNGCLGVTGTFSTFAVPITGMDNPTREKDNVFLSPDLPIVPKLLYGLSQRNTTVAQRASKIDTA